MYDIDTLDDLRNGSQLAYRNKQPYPIPPKKDPILLKNLISLSSEELSRADQALGDYTIAKWVYDDAKESYRKEEKDLMKKFRNDLETEFNMTNHPRKDKLFDLAWEEGHSEGLHLVLNYYERFYDLIVY